VGGGTIRVHNCFGAVVNAAHIEAQLKLLAARAQQARTMEDYLRDLETVQALEQQLRGTLVNS
jgi:hypothetical protein